MDKKAKNILQYLFWIAVAVVLVYFCLRSIDWEQFSQALRLCRWEYVLLSMVLGTLVFYIRGNRWRMLLLPFDPSTSRITTFNSYNICMAVNLALPRAGEVVKLGYVVKHSALDEEGKRLLSFDKALGTLLIERVWDALVTLGMAAVLLAVKWDSFGGYLMESLSGLGGAGSLWWILGGALLLIGLLLFLAWYFREKGGVAGKVWGFLSGIGKGLSSFLHMKNVWMFFVYTVLVWLIYWLMSACIVWALQDIEAFSSLTLTDAFFLMVAGSISSVVPVPGGFGAYHGVVAGALLSIWNIPIGTGMIFATLNHESQVITQAVCGLCSYLHESFIRKK
jgi:hypothetical protein